mmetsp:Transcript_34862/g.68830  ORF Transcript_34862/g.68830 Transcript_34862/m.68830 type:complete len:100 (+) Transcript_34862:74-373(+)
MEDYSRTEMEPLLLPVACMQNSIVEGSERLPRRPSRSPRRGTRPPPRSNRAVSVHQHLALPATDAGDPQTKLQNPFSCPLSSRHEFSDITKIRMPPSFI